MKLTDMKILGMVGKLQSGKTTISRYLREREVEVGEYIFIFSFASLLKEMILKSGLCSKEELWNKKTDFSRLMMQKIGTDIIRDQIDPDFWVKKMKEKIKETKRYEPNSIIIIDDVRYKNEASFIKEFKNSKLIRINRPSINSKSNHRSETEQDEIVVDFTIENIGTLDDLKKISKTILIKGD